MIPKAYTLLFKSVVIILTLMASKSMLHAQVSLNHYKSKIISLNFTEIKSEEPKSFPSLQRIISEKNKNYSSSFFCNIEAEIEKNTKFLVRFRLGSVDYVDRLEGKKSY